MDIKEAFKAICLAEANGKQVIISPNCYVCGKKLSRETIVIDSTYWKKIMIARHKDCSMEDTIKQQQEIDADCNDCAYFERGKMINKGIFEGRCKKKNIEVKAYPNFCSNHDCFKHRKDKK